MSYFTVNNITLVAVDLESVEQVDSCIRAADPRAADPRSGAARVEGSRRSASWVSAVSGTTDREKYSSSTSLAVRTRSSEVPGYRTYFRCLQCALLNN